MSRDHTLKTDQFLDRSIDLVFDFFSRPENLQSITPPWLDFRIIDSPQELRVGSLIRYSLRWRFVPIRWTTEITAWDPPHGFIDKQISGPYTLWEHEHRFVSENGGTRIRDTVHYSLPYGILGDLAHRGWVESDLRKIFDFRQMKIEERFGQGSDFEIRIRR